MRHIFHLLAACLLPLAVTGAVMPRQSPEPNCNPSCPTPLQSDYATVWYGTFFGVLTCEIGPNGEYWIECSYNSDGTINSDNSYPVDQCPQVATCQNERRRAKKAALPDVPAGRRDAVVARNVRGWK